MQVFKKRKIILYLLVTTQIFFSLQEYQSCNTLPCPDLKKTTPWTPWTPVNISDNGGHYEQRFRYTCRARVAEPNMLEVGRQRIEMRYCSSDGSTGCSTDGKLLFILLLYIFSSVIVILSPGCLLLSLWFSVCAMAAGRDASLWRQHDVLKWIMSFSFTLSLALPCYWFPIDL